jgi:hypothetical protein
MSPELALIAIKILDLVIEKGIPAFIAWNDGTEITDPTADALDALKVKKMSEKQAEAV